MDFQTIRLELENRIATLVLDRPSSGNVINGMMAEEFRNACHQLRLDDSIWVVVLSGNGNKFCCGTETVTIEGASDSLEALRSLRVCPDLASIDKPVIAALNGDAIDQGLEIALTCDIRIAAQDSWFGLTQIQKGLFPWDGGTQRLPRLIGRGAATEMLLCSRSINGEEALAKGLVSEIVSKEDVMAHANLIASTIVNHGPIAARYVKELLLKGSDMTLDQGLRLEADLNVILQSTVDRAEGIESFLTRRTPKYLGE